VRFSLLLCLLAASCTKPPETSFALTTAEARLEVSTTPPAFVLKNAKGTRLLETKTFATTIDRPTYIEQIVPGWDGYKPMEGAWVSGTTAARIVSKTATSATLTWDIPGALVTLTLALNGNQLDAATTFAAPADGTAATRYNKSAFTFVLPEDEHFFGLGERYATVDHRGWSLYNWAEEGALGGGETNPANATNPYPNGPSMTYFPVPFVISTRGYALHLKADVRSEFHLGSEAPDAWRIATHSQGFAFRVYVNDAPAKSLEQFTGDTGRPLIPAPWVFGPRRRIGSGSTVDGVLEWKKMRDLKMPITGVDDAVHFLPARSELRREVELQSWTTTMHANGFKVMGYYNPFVAQDHPDAAADYAFGKENGYFVKDPKGEPALAFLISGSPLHVAMIDFTNPDAVLWYKSLLKRALALGYDGWMHDFGEYVPRTGRFFDGRTGYELHNPYPMLSAKAAHEVLQEALPDDHLFFVRAGWTGSQAVVPAVWGGDPEASFDETQGLPSMLRGGVNLGLSGVPYWGSDVTGFKCLTDAPKDKEVFIRWIQLGAVSPIMMDQNACSNPIERQTKWQLFNDEQTIDAWRQMAKLHTRLLPYFLVLAKEANATGMPLMRHPLLVHPIPEALKVDDAFFLGPALYAAPVVRRGVTVRTLWLPPGRYVDLDDRTVFTGGAEISIPAPLDKLPLFLLEGQLLPLLDASVQTLAPATDPGVVTATSVADRLDVIAALAPGQAAELTLADGTVLRASRDATSADALTPATDLATCDRCVLREPTRLRVNAKTEASFDGVKFTSSRTDRLLRWDITLLP
jgi:sulfoquinovosidase